MAMCALKSEYMPACSHCLTTSQYGVPTQIIIRMMQVIVLVRETFAGVGSEMLLAMRAGSDALIV